MSRNALRANQDWQSENSRNFSKSSERDLMETSFIFGRNISLLAVSEHAKLKLMALLIETVDLFPEIDDLVAMSPFYFHEGLTAI